MTTDEHHFERDNDPYRDIELQPFGPPSDLATELGSNLRPEVVNHPETRTPPPELFSRFSGIIGDRAAILVAVEFLTRREASPWAVLVVAFNDDPQPSADLTKYERVFTSAGAGTMNMVDFFADMSHGKLDLSGTQVFGPYLMSRPRSDYVFNVDPQPPGKLNRAGLLELAKATAIARGVDLSSFAGVVVCATQPTDLCGFTGAMAALCDATNMQPSVIGQEMGHGYGVAHSRLQGSDADYQDPYDTMSTANALMAYHPEYGLVGPGLNAVNMSLVGWLDQARVRTLDPSRPGEEVITLRPLHARHLPGTLAISVGLDLIEFRTPTRWDAGIGHACVLVHRVDDDHSVLMKGLNPVPELTRYHPDLPHTLETGRPGGLYSQYLRVQVESIDEANENAVVRVAYEPVRLPQIPQQPIDIHGAIEVDGPGHLVINGHVHPIPPRGPDRQLVEALAGYLDTPTNPAARQEALIEVLHGVGAAARNLEVVSPTPPGIELLQRQRPPQSPA
jgi:hypothetical protein